ncbi:hypothetical protein AB0K09_05765 [Streptomyces sp. NPDC049577]|uniref:hypothetical protein n=1 Tax=Streptomyces sp. NPDC049577 TaxID=3155153 RepID=UPI003421FCF1
MRQRNDTTTPWHFAATETVEAHTVAPGETTEHPVLLDGWSATEKPDSPPSSTDQPPKARPKRTAADTDESNGGELR